MAVNLYSSEWLLLLEMASKVVNTDDKCGYCWTFYETTSDPRALPCGHICCRGCLNDDFEKNNKAVRCPECT